MKRTNSVRNFVLIAILIIFGLTLGNIQKFDPRILLFFGTIIFVFKNKTIKALVPVIVSYAFFGQSIEALGILEGGFYVKLIIIFIIFFISFTKSVINRKPIKINIYPSKYSNYALFGLAIFSVLVLLSAELNSDYIFSVEKAFIFLVNLTLIFLTLIFVFDDSKYYLFKDWFSLWLPIILIICSIFILFLRKDMVESFLFRRFSIYYSSLEHRAIPIGFSRDVFFTALIQVWFLHKENIKMPAKIIRIMILLLTIVLGILSNTRGPLISFIICYLMIVILLGSKLIKKKSKHSFLYAIVLSLFIILFVGYNPHLISGMTFRYMDLSMDEGRLQRMNLGLELGSREPFWGIGIGRFNYYSSMTVGNYPHNVFVEIFSEMGLLGLFSILIFILYTVLYLIKRGLYFTFVAFCYWLINAQISGDLLANSLIFIVPLLSLVSGKEVLVE